MTDGAANRREAWRWIAAHPGEAVVLSLDHVYDTFFGPAMWPSFEHSSWPLAQLSQYVVHRLPVHSDAAACARALLRRGARVLATSRTALVFAPIARARGHRRDRDRRGSLPRSRSTSSSSSSRPPSSWRLRRSRRSHDASRADGGAGVTSSGTRRGIAANPLLWVLLVYACGIAVRLIYTLSVQRPDHFIYSDMGLYVGLARRIAAQTPLGPADVTHPLGYSELLAFMMTSGYGLARAVYRAAGRHVPRAAGGRLAGRRRVRAAHRPAGGRVRQPLLPVHRVRRALSVRDPLHLLAGARVRRPVRARRVRRPRGARSASRRRRGCRAVDRRVAEVGRAARGVLFFVADGVALLLARPRGRARALVRRAEALAASRRGGRASRRCRCSACWRASARAPTRTASASRATRSAPTSCSATTAASRTSNGGRPGGTSSASAAPARYLRHYDGAPARAVLDDRQRRQQGARPGAGLASTPARRSCCRWTTSTTRSSASSMWPRSTTRPGSTRTCRSTRSSSSCSCRRCSPARALAAARRPRPS